MRYSNSFMHNLPALVKGRDRCTLQVSPQDADRIGLAHGGSARVTSRVGSVVAPVEITDDLMPGVVSLPHGWGHDDPASRLRVANAHPGVNTNVLTDDQAYDEASGTAVLFGTPVPIEPAGRGTMKAYRIETLGDEDALVLGERDEPTPGPNEVLVRVRATSLNRRDLMILARTYPLPSKAGIVPISDGAGEVVAVGENVRRARVGDRVAGTYFVRWLDGRLDAREGGPVRLHRGRDGSPSTRCCYEDSVVHVPGTSPSRRHGHAALRGGTAWSALTGPRLVVAGTRC